MNELIGKENCIWFSKKICKITEDNSCPVDCSLRELEFNKDSILNRMKEENNNIKELKKKGIWKNRKEIKDKIGGIMSLQKALKKNFNYVESIVVDKDLEITPFPTKGWRK